MADTRPDRRWSGTTTDTWIGSVRLRGLEVIHNGAGRTVYRATQVFAGGLERQVALKILHGVKPERAQRELRFAVELESHANIVAVHDVLERNDGTPCIIMEYCPGGSLARRCGQMSLPEVLAAATGIARALAHAHERGVLHRDVKPDNVLVRQDDPLQPSTYALSDFGTARLVHTGNTTSSREMTRIYASPQHLDGGPATVSDDIWALGATLFTLLDGTPPFVGMTDESDNPFRYADLVRTRIPRRLSTDVPASLRDIVTRCLRHDPGERFTSAENLHHAVAALSVRADRPAVLGQPSGSNELTVPARVTTKTGTQPPAPTPGDSTNDRPTRAAGPAVRLARYRTGILVLGSVVVTTALFSAVMLVDPTSQSRVRGSSVGPVHSSGPASSASPLGSTPPAPTPSVTRQPSVGPPQDKPTAAAPPAERLAPEPGCSEKWLIVLTRVSGPTGPTPAVYASACTIKNPAGEARGELRVRSYTAGTTGGTVRWRVELHDCVNGVGQISTPSGSAPDPYRTQPTDFNNPQNEMTLATNWYPLQGRWYGQGRVMTIEIVDAASARWTGGDRFVQAPC